MPLGSYIRNFLRFFYAASISICSQSLKKLGSLEKFGESGGQSFKGFDQEKCQFQFFGNFQLRAFAILGEVNQ